MILTAIGGNLTGDCHLACGFKNCRVVVNGEEDGLLYALLGRRIEIEAGDVIMRWRAGRGVYFDGGTSLGFSVSLNQDVGPISLRQMDIELKIEADVSLTVAISVEAQLGPIAATVEDVGTRLIVKPVASGVQGTSGNMTFHSVLNRRTALDWR